MDLETTSRRCPVCDMDSPRRLHEQTFAALPGLDKLQGSGFRQRLVACGHCGAQYIQSHLEEADLARYYATMSSYEYLEAQDAFPVDEQHRTARQIRFLEPYLDLGRKGPSTARRVLDIGSSVGYTLHRLKAMGCSVAGFEPSIALARIAQTRYGLDIFTECVGSNTVLPPGQDMVILSHVLEHLRSPADTLNCIRRCLSDRGLLFVEVPVIELFDERDLHQLSFEHLNYFSHGSLTNLLHRCGFDAVDHIIFDNDSGESPHYPTLGTLWRVSAHRWPMVPRDHHDGAVMSRYLRLIQSHAEMVDKRMTAAAGDEMDITLWGAGSLSAKLLGGTELGKHRQRIKAVLDIDPKKNGHQLEGIPIHHPDSDAGRRRLEGTSPIVIGSWSSQEAIAEDIVRRGVKADRIIRLFPSLARP